MMRKLAVLAGTGLLLWLTVTGAAPQSQPNVQDAKLKEIQLASGAFSLGDPVPQWVEDAALPEAAGVQQTSLRLLDTQVLGGDAPAQFIRRAVVIKDETALRVAGQISIRFVPEYQHVQLHALRVLRGGETFDQTRSVSVRFLQRETGLEQSMYSGVVTASILVNDLRVGDTLETVYTLYGQNPIFGTKLSQAASWDGFYPAAWRRVIVKTPAGRTIYWRSHGDGARPPLTPVETLEGGQRKLVFEERNVAGFAAEPVTPADYSAFRWLQFSEFSKWNEVAAWAEQLFQAGDRNNDELRRVADKISALPTDAERVAAALEFVQSEIRYFSVSIGESSHRPAQPSVVLARRFGDCKDKSLLLVSLLKALGIDAKPVLIKLGGRKWLEKALPSPADFDHVIVTAIAGGKAFYLDPTRLGQHGRLDRMGQVHEGTQGLVIAPQSHQLVTITVPAGAALSESEISETLTVTKLGGAAQLRFREVWNGAGAEARRVIQSAVSKEQLAKPFITAMEARYPGARLNGEPQSEDDRQNNVYSLAMVFDIPSIGTEKEGNWAIRYQPANLAVLPSITAGRTTPAAITAAGYHAKYSFEVQFPAEVSAMRDPESKGVEDKHFTFAVSQFFRGGAAKVTLDLKTRADRIAVPDIPTFIQKVRAVNELGTGVIIVTQNDIKTDSGLASGIAGRMHAIVQETIDKTTGAIKSGKLTGSDLGRAYCNRGTSYGYLGRLDEALAETGEALKIAPNYGELVACRAFVYLLRGEFAKSIAAYNTAVTLGQTTPDTFRSRGIAKFYAGRFEEAAEDFKKARDAGDKEEQSYNDLWLAWTNIRLKRPMDDASRARGETQAHDEWPRPALAMFAGKHTPEEILKTLDTKAGDERDMALAEGYFYAGEFYLAHGDKEKAREFFTKTRALNVLPYIEHMCAGFELQIMNAGH